MGKLRVILEVEYDDDLFQDDQVMMLEDRVEQATVGLTMIEECQAKVEFDQRK